MAKQKRGVGTRMHVTSEEFTGCVVYNERGEPVLRLGETVREGTRNGADVAETITEHIRTSGGTILSSESFKPGPNHVESKTCDVCERKTWWSWLRRSQPTISLDPAAEMQRCCRCHANLCPTHLRTSDYDTRPRCPRCNRWHRLYKRVIEPILFPRVKI